MTQNISSLFRSLPSVDALLCDESIQACTEQYGHHLVVLACRETLKEARRLIREEGILPDSLSQQVLKRVQALSTPTLSQLINATGVIIHTNLGRAPLSQSAIAAMREVGLAYSNLEFNMTSGRRGSRYDHAAGLLAELSGAEAGLVVNNNAAALVLMLSALAKEREVIVSRAHLIEIGGGFRIPDICRQSGAILREVGTTNRTYLRDYTEAVNQQAALLLRMHTSNFRIEGFTHQPEFSSLVEAAHERGLWLVDDVGSGTLLDTTAYGLSKEPMVQESIAAGADLVLFSGDKLLGGPQAGCLVGKQELVKMLRRHPLARALRVDKTTLAALDATLRSYQRGKATQEIPIWQMIGKESTELEATAWAWVTTLMSKGIKGQVQAGYSTIGGGSLPGDTLPTWLLSLPCQHPDRWAAALREQKPAVIVRIEKDFLLLDPRTVLPEQEKMLLNVLALTKEYQNE